MTTAILDNTYIDQGIVSIFKRGDENDQSIIFIIDTNKVTSDDSTMMIQFRKSLSQAGKELLMYIKESNVKIKKIYTSTRGILECLNRVLYDTDLVITFNEFSKEEVSKVTSKTSSKYVCFSKIKEYWIKSLYVDFNGEDLNLDPIRGTIENIFTFIKESILKDSIYEAFDLIDRYTGDVLNYIDCPPSKYVYPIFNIKNIPKSNKAKEPITGGIMKKNNGFFCNVSSIDMRSMYPSIIVNRSLLEKLSKYMQNAYNVIYSEYFKNKE